jgi:hypothetical protein
VGEVTDPSRFPLTEVVLGLGAFAVLVALVQTFRLSAQRALPRKRLAFARERGARGELAARPILERHGFTVLSEQTRAAYTLTVEGEPFEVDLRADFVVSLEGRRFVAEVKTGDLAPSVRTSTTRRQLLEYRLGFDVDGVLLVDAEKGTVRAVEFPPLEVTRESSSWLFWLAAGAALGAAATVGLLRSTT